MTLDSTRCLVHEMDRNRTIHHEKLKADCSLGNGAMVNQETRDGTLSDDKFGGCVYYEWHWQTRHILHGPRFPCRLCPLPGPSCLGTHWRIKQYVHVFQNAEDLFQPQRRLNNYFEHDFVQPLLLRAASRVNDCPTAI